MLPLLITSFHFYFQLQANPAEEVGNKYYMCRKVPPEKVLVSSSRQSLSALKHHHYMSFSAQLPLNTKRGIVQSNPVVNTKWSHFIATVIFPTVLFSIELLCYLFYIAQRTQFTMQSSPVVNTKWSHFIATALLLFSPLASGSLSSEAGNLFLPSMNY